MSYSRHYNTATANTNTNTNTNSKCAAYSTSSSCRTQYETPYQVVDLTSSPTQRTPSLSPWTFSESSISSPTPSLSRSPIMPALPTSTLSTSYRDPLRTVHGSPRVSKVDHRPMHPYQQQQQQQQIQHHRHESPSETAIPFNRRRSSSSFQQSLYDNTTNANNINANVNTIHEHPSLTHNNNRSQSSSSSPSPPVSPRRRHSKNNTTALPRRISLTTSPRSNSGRLPSLFDRIKAALEAPKRPTINTNPLPPIKTNLNLEQLNEQSSLTGFSSPTTTAITTQTIAAPPTHSNFTDNDLFNETNNQPLFWYPSMTTKPTLFGIPCSAASQKAYLRYSHDVKTSFQRLQLEDRGAVENRTIAFSTHLTISRWEPVPSATNNNSTTATTSTKNPISPSSSATSPSTTTTTACASTFANSAEEGTPSSKSTSLQGQPTQQQQQQCGSRSSTEVTDPPEQPPLQPQRDNPVHAARLISLANYIRHIISLSSGNSPLHSQSTLVQQRLLLVQRQQQQQRQLQKLQESRPSWATGAINRPQQNSASLPSPLSAGPGPMKNNSLSTRRHRQISEYHDHAARRQYHHQHQQSQSSIQDTQASLQRPDPTEALPSPTSPIFQIGRRSSQQQGNELPGAAAATGVAEGPKLALTLPKVPFPNLTLTLALIYVDRLKEKNPAAKGEPGCSHRLFLVAYIIAAKYRCSVELATLLQEKGRLDASISGTVTSFAKERREGDFIDKDAIGGVINSCEEEAKSIDQRICKARSYAEAILSNQAWVQLLSLGSFMRPIPASSPATNSSSSAAVVSARTSPSQPMKRSIVSNASGTLESGIRDGSEPKPLPIQSAPTTTADETIKQQTSSPPSSTSSSPSTALPPTPAAPSSILQVEDLDRMEAEFLTFLDYDLAARSQDLDTCWGLLVGNKAI